MIRVADYIVQRIQEEGVNHIFYVPGGQCVYLTDALRRNQNVEGISMHHEQAAAMAALTYASYNENFGACMVTTGCAGTNTMTGLLHAWQDSIPCIFISGQQNYNQTIKESGLPLRQIGIQEADIETIVKPLTKYAVTVDKAEDIVYHVDKAIYLAKTGRQGPVWIDVPLNIQNAMIDVEKVRRFCLDEAEIKQYLLKEEVITYVAEAIKNAERPIILAGNGIRSAHAVKELQEFVHKSHIPVTFSRLSSDFLPYDDEYNMGIVSGAGGASRYGNFAIQNSDLVLSIGCRLSIDTTGPERQDFARAAKIIVVDIDEVEHQKKGVRVDKFIHADAGDFLRQLNQQQLEKTNTEWLEKCKHWKEIFKPDYSKIDYDKPIDAKYFMEKLSENMPNGSIVISDAGFTGAAVPAATKIRENDRMIHSFAQGEMGYSLPGALGVAALTENTVIAYTGDGSFMMNLQELQTLVRNQFNVKIIIINNNGYSGVRHGQKAHFRGKSIGTDPSNGVDFPDYGKIADAFGICYDKINNYLEIPEKIEKVFAEAEPFILEVVCDPEQFDLHNALVMYGKRKFGFRPIEDQSPFIDRDVFFQEMIVEPLETSYGKPM